MTTKMGNMPPGTKLRNIRVDDELWEAAMKAAEARGENLSEAIRAFLTRYVKRSKP